MILQRLATSIRKQDWFTVLIETLIVVLGVFLGLQLGNWNEARKDRAAEQAIMDRLQAESEQVVGYWQGWVDYSEAAQGNRKTLLDVLHQGVLPPDREAAVQDGLSTMFHYPANNPPQAVLNEILTSGGFAQLSDENARMAVSAYLAELQFIDGQLQQFRLNMPQFLRAYDGRVFAVYSPEDPTLRRFDFDIEALSEDRDFKSDLVDLVRDQGVFHNYRINILNAAREMCDTLSAAIDTVCEPEATQILRSTGRRVTE